MSTADLRLTWFLLVVVAAAVVMSSNFNVNDDDAGDDFSEDQICHRYRARCFVLFWKRSHPGDCGVEIFGLWLECCTHGVCSGGQDACLHDACIFQGLIPGTWNVVVRGHVFVKL